MLRPIFLFILGTINQTSAFSTSGNSSTGGPTSSGLDDPSSEPEMVSRSFIEITNFSSNVRKETLPASFIERWPNWFLETDGSLSRIPDDETGIGFLTPTSIDQLYQPIDLKRPEMRLALGIHVRSGQIRHVMPALDVSYGNGLHRNRGLNSVPLAYNWVDFGYLSSLSDYNRYELRVSSKKQVGSEDDGEEKWNRLFSLPGDVITTAVEGAIVCLAEVDSDHLGDGSHIIHIALNNSMVLELPKPKNVLKVTLVEIGDEGEEDVDVGILEVAIVTTMSGSESEYLPDAYKPLYADESLRNPLYAKFQKRKEKRKEEDSKSEL